MRDLTLSTRLKKGSRYDKGKKLTVKKYKWEELVELLTTFTRTKETFAEFTEMESVDKLAAKDTGYIIGGLMDPPYRKTFNLQYRDVLVLDLDHLLSMLDVDEIRETYGEYAYVVHSTHSHSEDRPRLRIALPLKRSVTPDEYEPLARKVAEMLDMEMFDDTTYQFTRIMYTPSASSDGDTYTDTNDGEFLDPDKILSLYEDIEDVGSWPRSSRTPLLRSPTMQAQNPFTKPGIIGEFNRAYTIEEAIAAFDLPYVPSEMGDGRYTYVDGTSADGAIYYPDDGHLYSHHESDPGHGNNNAWDLVRKHKFGDDTEGAADVMRCPSMQQMVLLARRSPGYQQQVALERSNEFDDVTEEAEAEEQAAGAEVSSVPEKQPVNAITFKDILDWINQQYNTPDVDPETQLDEFLDLVTIANLGEGKTEQLVGYMQSYMKQAGQPGISKAGMLKSIKSLARDLVSRGTDGNEPKDIQMEFLNEFKEEYYVEGKHLKRTGKQWWTYTGTHWARRSEEYISGQLAKLLVDLRTDPARRKKSKALAAAVGESQTSSIHNSLWSMFQALTTLDTESVGNERDPMGLLRTHLPRAINCANGTLRFNSKGQVKLFPSKPEDLFTSVIDVVYDPEADCPNWMMFCQSAFSQSTDAHDMQRHLEELIGYILNQSRDQRAWVLLYGGTSTGKSTAGEVISGLLGEAAKNEKMDAYAGNNSHASAGLIGMQMLLDDDYRAGQLLNDGFLKSVSEEKRMTANPKGKDEFPFVCRAVPVILSNNAPATRDISGALADRALVFPFNHRVPASEKDIDLGRKLEKEYPGIFARCVKAYARMVKRGTWLFPTDCTVAWKKWQAQSNPLNLFIEQVVVFGDEEEFTKCADLWGAYGTWHAEEVAYGARGGTALTRNKFYESFEDATGLRKNRHMKLGNVYKGVTIDKSYQDFLDD